MHALKENMDGRFRSVSGACGEFNMSRNALMRIAAEANAIIKIGKSVKIDMPILYEHINKKYRIGAKV